MVRRRFGGGLEVVWRRSRGAPDASDGSKTGGMGENKVPKTPRNRSGWFLGSLSGPGDHDKQKRVQ